MENQQPGGAAGPQTGRYSHVPVKEENSSEPTKVLELRKENSWNGKIQQLFSDMHRLRKLLKLSESVCKVIVKNVIKGTGFVLFGNYILTNAHLFKDYVEGETLERGVEVSVDFYFNYDDTISHRHQVVKSYICPEGDLDYAVLEFNTEGQRVSNLKTQTQQNIKIPPGLLKDFSPVPPSGEAYLIGHPGGEVKKMDPTCIIEKEKREQAVDDHLHPYKDSPLTLYSIKKVVTYNTFMYHGSSGSPVFDAQCKVFGLHTAGFVYGFQKYKESVIEYAFSLHTILKHFVNMLKTKGLEELLKRFEEAAKGNSDLQEVLKSVSEAQVVKAEPADVGNLSDSSEPMDTD
ncbi:serine protease FAM111A-like [Pagrus major]|uniref:serine protease FAM111A-like n=1 Tax=Pagrus major TaxID=143350 RepID=UPI003CC86E69